jgi:hypothetical protein
MSPTARTEANPDSASSVQTLIDALSLALARPVLLDDPVMVPLAYSRQWGELDPVRTDSILSRGPTPAVREALLAQGIADARGVVRTPADPALGMSERVCVPVRSNGVLQAYIWLLDPGATLTDAELAEAETTAQLVAAQLAGSPRRVVPDHGRLLESLWSRSASERDRANATVRAERLLPDAPLVLCWLAGRSPGVDVLRVAREASRRLSAGHSLAGSRPAGAALLVSLVDPRFGTLPDDDVAAWLHALAGGDVAVGQSGVGPGLRSLPEAARQADVALRAARSRTEACAAWGSLGADRVVAQIPPAALCDVPEALLRLLRERPALAQTLEAFLEAAGDVRATAARLSLHRSGLYYRLRRIEELTGLRLEDGDDLLLAHLALRMARLAEHSS